MASAHFSSISFEGQSLLFAPLIEEPEWPEGTLSPLSPLFLIPESPSSCSAGDHRDAPLIEATHIHPFRVRDTATNLDWIFTSPEEEVFEDVHGCKDGPRWDTGLTAQAESLLLHVDPPDLDASTYFDFALFDIDMSISPLQEVAFLPQLDAAPSLEPTSDRTSLPLSPPFNDADAEGDTDTDATDVESLPSPYVDTRRKRRYLPYNVLSPSRTSRRHSSASSLASTSTCRSRARQRREPPNRNIQATLTTAQIESAIRSRTFACPAEKCTFVQKKRRMQDFVRHMESHNAKQWVCCGVPIAKARQYGITDITDAYEHEGKTMVGGCRHRFSRADAYKRHLDNDKCQCVGSVEIARNFIEKSNS